MIRRLIKTILCCLLCLSFSFTAFGKGKTGIRLLGRAIYSDENLSLNQNQSCKTCHHPSAGFADPANTASPHTSPVSTGSDGFSVGGRNAPTAAYAGYIPIFQETEPGVYSGGMFWDGRATGHRLGDPLAEQAGGPFLNPVEMALPDKQAAVNIVASSGYAELFLKVFPGTNFADTSPQNIDAIYDNIARAVAAFERSHQLNSFSSTFDLFWAMCKITGTPVSEIGVSIDPQAAPQGILNGRQLRGLALFNGKAMCSQCHSTTDYKYDDDHALPPMFTDFTYDNLGIPKNPRIDELKGAPQPIDYGLGGRADIAAVDPVVVPDGIGGVVTVSSKQAGKFKVSTLRNIAETAPYGHNGAFATLEDIVHFYNTRDVAGAGWEPPEVLMNMNTTELGNLGLSASEEGDLVEFLKALSDF